ncbi:uncharacterized protein LOC127244133 [Andrographis paniculata]|uniref:uncharacterized protein LOC127244133 n=1 Tax=Andrographis paniculata TaxID=175694 RepID=UPI0021E8EDE9|nr:uncharacterized protein LOC127244133 [Andrographis paniculata]XP_051120430.1 uncharacterized protein LOC127244133 [Andrographis paniculata]XP_051120431.1 uncharacterized protein LOC127244133 [Andrographis paniculata]XP_051120432.1 uncharacterized protein LOC127244133 [Andrographis paniculata]XP_051120433.1 uncharacterized protein LOC127244133 [Andrographis paniculata]XP_051120434.1 uncharacterized protein LOC127244133 [Andrographis paniculata]XP_051120435.1 uncharacterized protein LOC12724
MTPAEVQTPASAKSYETLIDEEEDKEEKKFIEKKAQLLAEIQKLQQKQQLEREKKRKIKVLAKLLKYWKPLTQLQLRFKRYLERKKAEQLEYEAAWQLVFLRDVTPKPAPDSEDEPEPVDVSSSESERQSPAPAEATTSASRATVETIRKRLDKLDEAMLSQYLMLQSLIDSHLGNLAEILTAERKTNAALESCVSALDTQVASLGVSQTELLKAIAAITQQNVIIMEQQFDITKRVQRIEELIEELVRQQSKKSPSAGCGSTGPKDK